jgi:hypothetical protein
LIASQGRKTNIDEYEDETRKSKYVSILKFHPFQTWKKQNEWQYELPKDEIPECLTMGSGWCAVATDAHFIRFFSTDGIQSFIMSTGQRVLSMVGYENLLAVVQLNGVPTQEV